MIGASRYIFSVGKLSKKDNSLTFRSDSNNGLVHLPIEGVKELYLMNEVSINTKLLDFLSKNGVLVHFFNYYGNYSGSYYPRDKYLSGRLRVEQAICYQYNRMSVACGIVEGIRLSMIDFLKARKYINPSNLSLIISEMIAMEAVTRENDIKNLLAVEGSMWQLFYKALKYIVEESFISNKRVKRPPDNPLNALISFGNSWLYTKTISQLYHTHLDQCISFLHEPSEGRFSLSLDISEVFKIVVVYPVIVTMINKKMLHVGKHFERDLNYCHLNEEGKKKFVVELERKLSSTFEHLKLKRKVSFETALKLEGYKLSKYLMEEVPFVPFREKVGV